MVAYTTTYSLKKPTVADDEDVWGGYLNDSMDLIDDLLDGTTPVTGIDINSGSLDNVTIGSTTANTGTFTVLSATTSLGVTGNITVSGTVDGVDIATRDAVLTTTTTTANAALPKAGGTMTGAITFATGQTFDGRDVSADGAKLDGIESGATADQTKADIDALGIAASTAATLATARNIALSGDVSGSASFNGSANISITATVADDSHNHVISNVDGLQTALDGKLSTSGTAANSQLLDSLDSSQFLRSDAGDTSTQRIVFSANATNNWDTIGTATGSLGSIEIKNDVGDAFMAFHVGGDYAVYFGLDNATNDLAVGGWSMGANQYKIWHQGNDGSGSGLDADTVDGIQASSFLRSDTTDSTASTISFTGDIQVGDQIFHYGDTDTYIQFHAADQFRVVTGGTERLEVNNTRTQIDTLLTDAAIAEDYDALSGTTPTADPDAGGAFSLTMTGNTTFTFGAPALGSGVSTGFIIELTGNGSTVTWPASVEWAGGTAPDAPASGETDIYIFWTRDGGTTWYGVQSIDAAA